ncbi:hypothetical protein [Mycolicibacterium aubagnense]|uniref:ESX-1 secretion-associated protein EspH n=1 Tax=Mycolicibacterium aubagnense TaxID=319707 RepID=A0ABM7IH57_9MYCO|nr:hypothetical protein [Mycolicibacterium aubagnense]WGI32321.1 hypothetical protein QDT91_24605 [Mycolicibacterium aubagnense]BBX86112.1 hypothetical protein MAUB_39850 [Mycolicibacterium aubagnense]
MDDRWSWDDDDDELDGQEAGTHAGEGDVDDEGEDELEPLLYTASNPSGSVWVTAHLNGRVHGIELGSGVTAFSEHELAEEIRVVAELSRQQACSELHGFVVEGVREMGYDPAPMRDALVRKLNMPTPEDAAAETARIVRDRYWGGG